METLLDQLSNVRGAKFATFTYRSRETGELAKFHVTLGVDMTAMYTRDRDTLATLVPMLDGLQKDAAEALLKSIQESLAKGLGNNSQYTHGPEQGNTYVSIPGAPGVKLNMNDGVLHVLAMVRRKDVLEPGTYKVVNSAPLTLAKRDLERQYLQRAKVRQFRFPNIRAARLNGETLEFVTADDLPPVGTPAHV